RQYVPADGQRWTTLAELRREHGNWIRDDAGFVGIGTEPSFAIGQRALLVPHGDANVMWDCITLLDDETAEAVEQQGGLAAVAISRICDALEPFSFDRIVGAWWDRLVPHDGKSVVTRSAERYVRALRGEPLD